jgi:hypothetical protein
MNRIWDPDALHFTVNEFFHAERFRNGKDANRKLLESASRGI